MHLFQHSTMHYLRVYPILLKGQFAKDCITSQVMFLIRHLKHDIFVKVCETACIPSCIKKKNPRFSSKTQYQCQNAQRLKFSAVL